MTTRSDVDDLLRDSRRLVTLAMADLDGVFGGLDLSNPAAVRNALIEITPLIVREYGDVMAVVAAEWYEDVRARQVGPGYLARADYEFVVERVEGSVRWAAGSLWSDDPGATLGLLGGAVQRYISYAGRAVVARNAEHDPAKPRFARVPTGAKTCAWCEAMASRGFVYHSEVTAGDSRHTGFGDDFHDDCDCQIVVEFDRGEHHIAGYDPDAMYTRYAKAAAEVGNTHDLNAIVAQMRSQNPGFYTDSPAHSHD